MSMNLTRRFILLLAVVLFFARVTWADQPFVQVLASSARNVGIDSWEASSRTVTPDCPVAWSIRKYKLHGGKQEGVDVIVVDNGKLQVAVCPTRGMGVLWATLGDERLFYGPKLEIWTDLSTEPGSSGFRIADVITNRGDAAQEFQILYHTNFGTPLLGEGATFVAAIERITPFNAHAAEGMGTYGKYARPTLGFVEQVYKIKPAADAQGRTMALLKNAKGDRAASLAFNVKQLPYLTQWKSTNAVGEGYVTGIEPGTSFPHNRRVERQHGRVPKLAAGESRNFEIDYTIHVGEASVKAAVERVAAIQDDRKPQGDVAPEKID